MLSAHTLKAQRRERVGSRYAQRERTAGRLPGVVYGHGQDPVAITLDAKEANKFFYQGEKVFTIEMSGESTGQTVILRDLQFDFLGTDIVHVDLARVDLDEKITANVHVKLVGEAAGLKKAGAILTHPNTQISIHCTVRTLPDHVDVNISELDLGQAVHASDVKLPEGITLASDPDAIVAAVTFIKEEVVVAEAVAVEGAAAEPEVITAKKMTPEETAAAEKAAAADKGKEKGDKGKEKKEKK